MIEEPPKQNEAINKFNVGQLKTQKEIVYKEAIILTNNNKR